MLNQEKKKNPRNTAMFLDLLHIAVGILVVVCAVLAFLNPDAYQILFPVIFWLAGLLNGVNGWTTLQAGGRDKKKKFSGILQCVLAAVLFLIGVMSAVSIWR